MKKSLNRVLGALALYMAIVIGLSFAGAAALKTLRPEAENTESVSAQQIDAAVLTSIDTTSTSEVKLNDVSDVVTAVMPSVVSITSRAYAGNYFGSYLQSGQSSEEVEAGIGSGTIVGSNNSELLILTSYHVVEDSSSLYVTFCNDTSIDGYIKASSPEDDIAVVAVPMNDISGDTLKSIAIARICNDENEIGDGVIVIGNALGYGQSVVTGIISALDRQITVEGRTITVIQTDAAINSGNSGGCTLNSKGEVIGISEAKISNDAVEGMCYAISVRAYYDKIMEMLNSEKATTL